MTSTALARLREACNNEKVLIMVNGKDLRALLRTYDSQINQKSASHEEVRVFLINLMETMGNGVHLKPEEPDETQAQIG